MFFSSLYKKFKICVLATTKRAKMKVPGTRLVYPVPDRHFWTTFSKSLVDRDMVSYGFALVS